MRTTDTMRSIIGLAATAIALGGATQPAAAMPPQIVPVQGNLTDDGGDALDGTFSITFRIYDANEAGNMLFEQQIDVDVDRGFFTVYLGEDLTLPIEPFIDNEDLFLGITVEDDEEGTPRLRLASGAFALTATLCGNALALGGNDPDDYSLTDHEHAAADISSGTLSPNRYSAYADLEDEGRLADDDGEDLITFTQGDAHYAAHDHGHTMSCHRVESATNNGQSGTGVDAAYIACPVGEVMTGGGCTANSALQDSYPVDPCGNLLCLCLADAPCATAEVNARGGWGCVSTSTSDSVVAYAICCTLD